MLLCARRHGTYPAAHSFAALQKILGRADPWRDASTGLLIIDLAPGRYARAECPRFEILSGSHRVAVTQAGEQQMRLAPGRYGVRVLSGTTEQEADVVADRITFITVP